MVAPQLAAAVGDERALLALELDVAVFAVRVLAKDVLAYRAERTPVLLAHKRLVA